MTDRDLNDLVRMIAAEPVQNRHESLLLPRLEIELRRSGLLGDQSRIYELGQILRRAGLTNEGDRREHKAGEHFHACPTAEEFAAAKADEPRAWREGRERSQKRYGGSVLEEHPDDENLYWHSWQVPPIGTVVTRRLDNTGRPRVVSGAYCDRILNYNLHSKSCPSCTCFELSWTTGFWRTDEYCLKDDGSIVRMRGCAEDDPEGFTTGCEAPHCLRPLDEKIPVEIIRPSIRAAYERRMSS